MDIGELGVVFFEFIEFLKGDGGVRVINFFRFVLLVVVLGLVVGFFWVVFFVGGVVVVVVCVLFVILMVGSGWILVNVVMVVGSWIFLGIR